jgi:YHS domain-containing protein
MKKTINTLALLALLVSCNNASENSAENQHKGMHEQETVSIKYTPEMVSNKTDFICGMPTTAGISDTCQIEGKAYGFCSAECMAEFKKDPGKYVAQQ